MSATTAINPESYIHYHKLSYPPLTKEVLDEKSCLPTDIENLVKEFGVSKEKAIYALTLVMRECKEKSKIFDQAGQLCRSLIYDLKFKPPKEGIESIIGTQTSGQCNIYAKNGRPVYLSKSASEHYGVSTLEEMIGKSVMIFRKSKDANGHYELPYKYHLHKGKLVGLEYTFMLNMATAKVETEKGVEHINFSRVCIDWEA